MALFRCLLSETTTNYITGADLGTTTTSKWTLINTPIVAGTLTGTIIVEGVDVQTFTVDVNGVFQFANIESPEVYATAGTLNLGLCVVTLTWSAPPGSNYGVVSYTGLPVYKYVTMKQFNASCPPPAYNPLCNPNSVAYVAAVTVCDQSL